MQVGNMRKILTVLIAIVIALMPLSAGACSQEKELILASTTSTMDSGLFDELLPAFKKATGYNVKVIAVGTGEAIELGRKGEADVILVHSRAAEDEFVGDGFGINRRDVMHNDYLIVGPAIDPAGASGAQNTIEAFFAIFNNESLFVSRGDNSGTHKKELSIWKEINKNPEGAWYIETGQGMGATLRIAEEKQGYTLTDRGTWLAQKKNMTLAEIFQKDEDLFNPYGIIALNPQKHPNLKINYEGAMLFIEWITGQEGQEIIRGFGIEKYGEPLFFPDAIK